jgi:hypothetical protein
VHPDSGRPSLCRCFDGNADPFLQRNPSLWILRDSAIGRGRSSFPYAARFLHFERNITVLTENELPVGARSVVLIVECPPVAVHPTVLGSKVLEEVDQALGGLPKGDVLYKTFA